MMDRCSTFDCDGSFYLVDNIQQQQMVSLFRDMNFVVSTSVKELDDNNKQFY